MYTLQKTTPEIKRQRMTIKSFKFQDDMHKFLNKQCDNNWRVSTLGLKAGVYAYAGGQWHNVKHLDVITLCHI